MKYLVTMELMGTPPADSPQEFAQFLEQVVIPSEEAVIRLEAEGKILAGGDITGQRGWALIMETASNEELSEILESIPEWSLMQVDVIPLDSTKDRLSRIHKLLENLKAASG